MDFGGLPPEINSARMYAGPGSGPMLAAAAAWASLGAELNSAASSYGSSISALTSGPWVGPSSLAMAAAVTPYVEWMSATGEQAELAASQAYATTAAYEAAFAMTVPPPVIAANRAQLLMLVATNLFGQNTPAIAATEAEYAEMWAQDAGAMYSYAANTAAATAQMTPFTAAPETASPVAAATQGAAVAQAAGSVAGSAQSTLSQLMSAITSSLQSLASPSGLLGNLSGLLSGSSSAVSTSGLGGLTSTSGFSAGSLLEEYLYLPGFFGAFAGLDALQPALTGQLGSGAAAAAAGAADGAAADGAAAAAAGAADGAMGSGLADLGGLAGLGQAASLGGLSVPPTWGWAAAAPAALMGSAPLGMLTSAAVPLDVGGGLGFPFMFPGMGRGAAVAAGAGAIAGAAAANHGSKLRVVARPPAAGYPAEEPRVAASNPKYPPPQVPAGFPTNGHAPPGYQAAVIYVPTNGHAPADK